MIEVQFYDGLLQYETYMEWQRSLRQERKELLLFCQHPPTITGGIQSNTRNLLLNEAELQQKGVPLVFIKRGGDVTAHEPGQVVTYPHIDLKARNIRLTEFFDALLEISREAIRLLTGVELAKKKDFPGLYRGNEKVCAIGVEAASFFTSSGIAVNANNSLETFESIVACGLEQFRAQSLRNLTGGPVDQQLLCEHWARLFQDFLARPNG